MGSGGFEEGVMAAVAGKVLDAAVEGKGWSADSDDNKWFGLEGVRGKDGT